MRVTFRGEAVTGVADEELVGSLFAAAQAVESSAAELNRLDGYAGDGDLGITMSQAARALREVLASSAELEMRSCSLAAVRRSHGAPRRRAGPWLPPVSCAPPKPSRTVPSAAWKRSERAFVAATEGIKARGKASVGDRTLVDGTGRGL